MKKLVMFLLAIAVLLGISKDVAAQHNMATWYKMRDGKTTVIPWYVYSTDKFFVDARYNFDAAESAAVFVGKPIGLGETQVIPAIGGIAGKYNSVSAEVNIIGKLGSLNYFTLNQYSFGMGNSPNFVYHWCDLLYPLSKHILVGADEQWYWEPGSKGAWDAGPVVKVKAFSGLYAKAWLAATNTGSHKFFLGFGFAR